MLNVHQLAQPISIRPNHNLSTNFVQKKSANLSTANGESGFHKVFSFAPVSLPSSKIVKLKRASSLKNLEERSFDEIRAINESFDFSKVNKFRRTASVTGINAHEQSCKKDGRKSPSFGSQFSKSNIGKEKGPTNKQKQPANPKSNAPKDPKMKRPSFLFKKAYNRGSSIFEDSDSVSLDEEMKQILREAKLREKNEITQGRAMPRTPS